MTKKQKEEDVIYLDNVETIDNEVSRSSKGFSGNTKSGQSNSSTRIFIIASAIVGGMILVCCLCCYLYYISIFLSTSTTTI